MRRDQSPTYGDGGHCACIPARRSIAASGGDLRALEEQLPRERRAVQLLAASASAPHPAYATAVTVRVRMAPSPTGLLHIGGVRTALFNWLYARHAGRRVPAADREHRHERARWRRRSTRSRTRSRWLGLDWDGPHTFQLDRIDDCRRVAEQLVADGKAYEDEGAIRFRMPDEGSTAWDDVVRGRVEFPNETLEDLVLVRSDGRPTYNFASPMEDVWDGITHVIRGEDHISNTPKQINIIRAVGAELPVYAHVPNVIGADGKKLSKRHGAISRRRVPRATATSPEALLNFLALLGWAPDGETTIMSRDELIERFTPRARQPEPGAVRLREARLDERRLPARARRDEFARRLVALARRAGLRLGRASCFARGGAARAGEDREARRVPRVRGLPLRRRRADPAELDGGGADVAAARTRSPTLEPFTAEAIETALRGVRDGSG